MKTLLLLVFNDKLELSLLIISVVNVIVVIYKTNVFCTFCTNANKNVKCEIHADEIFNFI